TSDYVATGSRGTLGHWNESWPSSFSSIGVMDTCHSCWALPVEVVDEDSVALHTTSATAKIWFWALVWRSRSKHRTTASRALVNQASERYPSHVDPLAGSRS